ncbi:MAG TPA: hypothetical protein VIJ27_12670, partial [Mucilaginibacter sp.]
MKTIYKSLLFAASGTFLCLLLTFPASAQRNNSNGGGTKSSGGSGGGGSVSSARPSGGGSSFNSRASMGNVGVSRPSANVQRPGFAPQRVSGQVYGNRPGIGYTPRPGIGYTPRPGIGYTPR